MGNECSGTKACSNTFGGVTFHDCNIKEDFMFPDRSKDVVPIAQTGSWKAQLTQASASESTDSPHDQCTIIPIHAVMVVHKDFFPTDLFARLSDAMQNSPMLYGWKAHEKNDPHGHWNIDFTFLGPTGAQNLGDVSCLLANGSVVKEAWEYAERSYPHLRGQKLLRLYMNGHTFGTDGYFHRDSERDDETTCVVYMNKEWVLDWGGETVFAKDGGIIFSFLPAPNAATLFNSKTLHCARGVSRKFCGLRRSFVIKVRKPRSSEFEAVSDFLVKQGALWLKHTKGSLHAHLMRTFQLLENRGVDQDICKAAAIHSVFGTNIFKKHLYSLPTDLVIEHCQKIAKRPASLLEIKELLNRLSKISPSTSCVSNTNLTLTDQTSPRPYSSGALLSNLINMFSSSSVYLAVLFSIIQRPQTIESPRQQGNHPRENTPTHNDGVTDDNDDNGVLYYVKLRLEYVSGGSGNEVGEICIDSSQLHALRLIECSNLADQGGINQSLYPTLFQMWSQLKEQEGGGGKNL